MKDLEKQIEEAAEDSTIDYDFASGRRAVGKAEFILGAKSQAAKEYWQQEMYNKDEIEQLLSAIAIEATCKHCDETWVWDLTNPNNATKDWFEQNKKK